MRLAGSNPAGELSAGIASPSSRGPAINASRACWNLMRAQGPAGPRLVVTQAVAEDVCFPIHQNECAFFSLLNSE